jgi:uncharacterized DUF497 family protein
MRIVWDVRKAAVNLRNHGVVEKTLCAMLYATIYLERRVYEEKE